MTPRKLPRLEARNATADASRDNFRGASGLEGGILAVRRRLEFVAFKLREAATDPADGRHRIFDELQAGLREMLGLAERRLRREMPRMVGARRARLDAAIKCLRDKRRQISAPDADLDALGAAVQAAADLIRHFTTTLQRELEDLGPDCGNGWGWGLSRSPDEGFDPSGAAEALEMFAQLALQNRYRYAALGAEGPMFEAAALIAREARGWLAEQLAPMEWFAGEVISSAHANAGELPPEGFASAVRGVASELVHVQRTSSESDRLSSHSASPVDIEGRA